MSIIISSLDKYYSELSKPEENVKTLTIKELEEELLKRSRMNKDEIQEEPALYEVLKLYKRAPMKKIEQLPGMFINKFFLDLEKLPYHYSLDKVKEIVNKFIKFLCENIEFYNFSKKDKEKYNINDKKNINDINFEYVLTHNELSSSHVGDSYHVIFQHIYIFHTEQTKNIVKYFISKNEEYINYIDFSVYSSHRLFRLQFSKNVNGKKYEKEIYLEDFHKPVELEPTIENLRKFIIHDITLETNYIIILNRKNPINNVSLPYKRGNYSGRISHIVAHVIDNYIYKNEHNGSKSNNDKENSKEIKKEILIKMILEKQTKELENKTINELEQLLI